MDKCFGTTRAPTPALIRLLLPIFAAFVVIPAASQHSTTFDQFLINGDTAGYIENIIDIVVKDEDKMYPQDTMHYHLSNAVELAREIKDSSNYFLGKFHLIPFAYGVTETFAGEKELTRELIAEIKQASPKREHLIVLANAYFGYGLIPGLSEDSTVQYIQKAIDLFPKVRDTFLLALNYRELAKSYKNLGKTESCIEYGRKAIQTAGTLPFAETFLYNHIYLADCLISKGDWMAARPHVDSVRERVLAVDWNRSNFNLLDLCKDAAWLYERMELYEEALNMQKIYNDAYALKSRHQLEKEMRQLRVLNETQEKEKKILSLELEKRQTERQRRRLTWFFAVSILSIIGMFAFYRLRQNYLMRETKYLKEIDAFKTRLFTNITHEFRTPLTVILGLAEEIRGNKHVATLIRRNGQKLLNLINQVLDLQKLEANALQLSPLQVDIVPFLQEACQSFQSLADSKNIQLVFRSSFPELIMDVDLEKFQNILANLLSNALKFTPSTGKVTMAASQRDNYLVLTISDDGIGIPAEELPYIFDRFFQVAGSSTRREVGTGIGLALVKELVELMQGTITVESAPERGSTFTIRLPITKSAPPGKISSLSTAPKVIPSLTESTLAVSEKKIDKSTPLALIVEDNEDVAAYLHRCLREQYCVLWARDGQEGLEQALEHVPDIIISDVLMPRRDGFELCRILKNDERTSHIPIILLTAKAEAKARRQGLERGADAYLTKPFDRVELEIRLRKLIELRKRLLIKYSATAPEYSGLEMTRDPEWKFLNKLEKVIMENLSDENFKVEPDLCRKMAMSRPQLFRKLKALKGQSPSQFVRAVRMQRARQLLRDTNLPVGEIANRVGFREHSYFSRVYQTIFNEAPSQTRQT